MADKSKKMYSGEAEDLNNIANETTKKSVDTFVNPGTPENPLVDMNERKTGIISGSASQKLKDHLNPKG